MTQHLAWGARVSAAFRNRVIEIGAKLSINPSDLMTCMAFESARTFRADIPNGAGSGAVGLIQFMPQTAAALDTSTDALARMTPETQLQYVEAYFAPRAGRLHNLGDVYMAILWPAGIGRPDSFVLFDKNDEHHPARYVQNAGLDYNHDGQITRGEVCRRIYSMLDEGLRPENVA